ncbi:MULTISPECIES: tRNA-uridine aminocarboxypropyltransferase [unclassified Massilia]|uniref:tRNA-uridine aminocarboxypropyltransferase n=1 Tax=unclassified Massilia TaxID=2609279 RepID=UPI0017842944|nr:MULTISPECIES: tRNA-uridine aminocarboxypropyltransferase [unclassified Massilia]MBD8532565.1 DTW domain-containing protein [Massilia sp. CFBP 13647]MBD8672945.1 DTW domain-containing protein [Massilia sp. CFBP 13721]
MTSNQPSRRAACASCLRAQSACICAWVRPVALSANLLVLQHPLEVANAKNSARLLHLCVAGSRLAVGEAFEPDALDAMLHAEGRTPVLLYPETPGSVVADAARLAPASQLLVVVLDATWRKSRKMLYLNPALQALPRLALSDMPSSGYRIRKAHAADQLSSMEAGAHALGQAMGDMTAVAPLFEAFDGFVQQQAAFVPPGVARTRQA